MSYSCGSRRVKGSILPDLIEKSLTQLFVFVRIFVLRKPTWMGSGVGNIFYSGILFIFIEDDPVSQFGLKSYGSTSAGLAAKVVLLFCSSHPVKRNTSNKLTIVTHLTSYFMTNSLIALLSGRKLQRYILVSWLSTFDFIGSWIPLPTPMVKRSISINIMQSPNTRYPVNLIHSYYNFF